MAERKVLFRYGGLVALAALLFGGAAFAQTVRTEATPFVIRSVPAPQGELTAKPNAPLLVQPVTSMRAARLEGEASTAFGVGRARSLPAGALLFGVQREEGGWSYCALAASTNRLLFGRGGLTCYDDEDGDGRFEQVRPSGDPFLGVPLFILQLGKPSPLAAPVRYTRLPYAEGPSAVYGLKWSTVRATKVEGRPLLGVRLTPALGADAASLTPIQGGADADPLSPEGTGVLRFRGAEIEALGLTAEGALRYRVRKPLPTQLERVTLSVTTRTTYTPIILPR